MPLNMEVYMAEVKETKKEKEIIKDEKYYNELVTVTLFQDGDKYKDDVFVAVNGVGMLVPRGKEVQIPRKFAIALENSQKQSNYALKYCAELANNN